MIPLLMTEKARAPGGGLVFHIIYIYDMYSHICIYVSMLEL